jgi:peptidoglycan/LPS O-acetylase OafA/YrhL
MTFALSIYLDLIRLFAASMVVFQHANGHLITGAMLWRLTDHGTESVVLFFVLSGFVIGYVVAEKERDWRSYLLARASRIYSVALIAVPVTLIADGIGSAINPDFYAHLTFYRGFSDVIDVLACLTFVNELWFNHYVFGTNEPYWSLGFEVWYYLIFGMAFFYKGRGRILSIIALLLLVGPKLSLYFFLWLLGYWTFRITSRMKKSGYPSIPLPVGILCLAGCPILYWIVAPYFHLHKTAFLGNGMHLDTETIFSFLYFVILGWSLCLNIIGYTALSSIVPNKLLHTVGPIVRWAAGASFSLYLLHQPILVCLAALSPFPNPSISRTIFVLSGTVLIVFLLAELGERRKRVVQNLLRGTWRFVAGRRTLRLPEADHA